MSIKSRWKMITDAVHGYQVGRRFWKDRPTNEFTTSGFEVIDGFLARSECDRLVELAERVLEGPSHRVEGNCYTWVKSESRHGRNSNSREVLNVNEIDSGLAELLESRVVQGLFEERLGEPVELQGFGIQYDGIDVASKRGFHVDQLTPPMFKAFIYLTDVEEEGDGPFTIIPGSHRLFGLKLVNDVINAFTSGGRRDMFHFTAKRPYRAVLGPAGTAVLATQDAIHKGWDNQWRRSRYALIAYGTTAEHFKNTPLTYGVDFVERAEAVS